MSNILLKYDPKNLSVDMLEDILNTSTIFDKIEFSNISKKIIKEKLTDLRTRQVPNRNVLLNMETEDIVEYWFKNWLHPELKHWVPLPSKDTRGCSKTVLENDSKKYFLNFYENSQFNFKYTIKDIEEYINE